MLKSRKENNLIFWLDGRAWLNAPDLKSGERESVPWVQILLQPPYGVVCVMVSTQVCGT